MKNICIIAHLNDLSGANKSLVDLADHLRNVFDITVVVPRKGELYTELNRRGIRCKNIFSGTWVCKKDESILKKIIKFISNIFAEICYYFYFKKNNFDLIHFNSSVYGCGAMSAIKLHIPYTWHIRELAESNFNLTFFNRQKSIELINSAMRIITISAFMKNVLSRDFDQRKLQVIYNGVLPKNKKESLEIDKFDLVVIGAIAEDKGQLDAIKALKELHNLGNDKIKLYLVGKVTDQNYYNVIQREISDDIKDFVFFTGYKNDVSEYRSSNYIALICSKAEAFGRVTIEAMNEGQIIIGAKSGATPEIITDGYNGFLYETGNSLSLTSKIVEAINYDEKEDLIDAGYATVRDLFSINNTVENVGKVFEEVIDRCHL